MKWALMILAAELAARWLGDPLDKAGALLRMDAELGWRQRESWSGTFMGADVALDERGLRTRLSSAAVVALGPSSTFGWGVAESDTYAARLGALNAGQIGYSSWQGAKLALSLPASTVIVAYGVNDVDLHRFFFADGRPDSAALPPDAWPGRLRLANALSRARLLPWLRRRLLRPFAKQGRGVARVSEAEYKDNLRALAKGRRAVFVTSPIRLPDGAVKRDVLRYNQAMRSVAAELKAPLVDAELLLTDQFVDPVHPSAEGHRLIAEALRKVL